MTSNMSKVRANVKKLKDIFLWNNLFNYYQVIFIVVKYLLAMTKKN